MARNSLTSYARLLSSECEVLPPYGVKDFEDAARTAAQTVPTWLQS